MDVCCHCWYDYLQTCPPNTRWQTRAALTGTPYYTKTPAPLMECTVIPCCIWTVVPVQVLDGIPVPLLWAAGPSGGVFHRVSAEWHQSAGGAWGLVQYVVTLSYKSICLFFSIINKSRPNVCISLVLLQVLNLKPWMSGSFSSICLNSVTAWWTRSRAEAQMKQVCPMVLRTVEEGSAWRTSHWC